MTTILIDNGHGQETPGKRSPHTLIREYLYTRNLATVITDRLNAIGLNAHRLVPENTDIPLSERCRRANRSGTDTILLSLHLNAAGSDGKWHNASGFSCYVAPNASARSRWLAKELTTQARHLNLTGNRAMPPAGFLTQNLAICRDTICPAVLTESLFMDNRTDAATLLSPEGFDKIVTLHVNAITSYFENFSEK